ncbi:MAG: exodeoxyribonuclease VII small subunit [Bacteroidales bacterium]|nr:exodeoxyribonuclease VII small subunit [Bacteroidales bacterium]MDT8431668.1 exodeoxyribonuclease VII small subunit [Bacteroidales bacterium]
MADKEITYKAAVAEIELILGKIEEGELDVDELTENVKRVTRLLNICKEKLQKTETEVNKILSEED